MDSAQDAKLIVDMVANFNWPPGSEFVLLHVMTPDTCDPIEIDAQKQQTAENLLAALSQQLKQLLPKCRFEKRLMRGVPHTEILWLSGFWDADMIVMGWRARTQADCFLAGSVSKAVSREAPCSVCIVRPPKELRKAAEELGKTTAASHC